MTFLCLRSSARPVPAQCGRFVCECWGGGGMCMYHTHFLNFSHIQAAKKFFGGGGGGGGDSVRLRGVDDCIIFTICCTC